LAFAGKRRLGQWNVAESLLRSLGFSENWKFPWFADQQHSRRMTTRRKWRIGALAVVLATVCLFHASLLRGLVRPLIVEQTTENYDCVCVPSWGYQPRSSQCYDRAAELYAKKPSCSVLLIAPTTSRLDEIGIMPSFEAICRRELQARHVPPGAIAVVQSEPWNDWATARSLARWMNDHRGQRVLLLPDQFRSGQMRRAMYDVLKPDAAALLYVQAVRTPDCNETNWWKQRSGYRAFAESWLLRLQPRPERDAAEIPVKNADEYERAFLKAFREKTP
jgi:hypothetical protein